jgi:2'-5' RNA ligase
MPQKKYEFSSTQINLPSSLAREIMAWGSRHIPDDIVFRDPENPGFGREHEMHVTVLYGLHTETPGVVKTAVSTFPSFDVELAATSLFTSNESFDVVKLGVRSPELHRLNKIVASNCAHTNKFPTFQPHVTIAYIKKGKGWKLSGDKTFDGKLFHAEEIMFSPRNNTKKIAIRLSPS